MKQSYSKGDIVDVDLGLPPNAIKGHEQAKERPCLIIKSFDNLKLAIILPITSSQPTKPVFTIVHLASGIAGLTKTSYVLCHQIRTVSFERIKNKRGKLDSINFLKIQTVLFDTLT